MKYQLRAALAAIALVLLPGALLAGSASEKVVATGFNADTRTVTGLTSSSEVRKLRHTSATFHDYARVDLPPGPNAQARALAIQWNMAVFQNKPASFFDRLLDRAAELGVILEVERTDAAGPDGAFELVKVAPSQ
jgi:hypothetical protein